MDGRRVEVKRRAVRAGVVWEDETAANSVSCFAAALECYARKARLRFENAVREIGYDRHAEFLTLERHDHADDPKHEDDQVDQ
jgi:hypothetical protein